MAFEPETENFGQDEGQVSFSRYDFFPEEWGNPDISVSLDEVQGQILVLRDMGYTFAFDAEGKYYLYTQSEGGLAEIYSPMDFSREVVSEEQLTERVEGLMTIEEVAGRRNLSRFREKLVEHRKLCTQIDNELENLLAVTANAIRNTEQRAVEEMRSILFHNIYDIEHRFYLQNGDIGISRFQPIEIELEADKVKTLKINYIDEIPDEEIDIVQLQEWEESNRRTLAVDLEQGIPKTRFGIDDVRNDLEAAGVYLALTSENGSSVRVGAIQDEGEVLCTSCSSDDIKEMGTYLKHLSSDRHYLTQAEVDECQSIVRERGLVDMRTKQLGTLVATNLLDTIPVPDTQRPVLQAKARELGDRMRRRLTGYMAVNGGNRDINGRIAKSIKDRIIYHPDLRGLDRHKLYDQDSSLRLVTAEQSLVTDGDIQLEQVVLPQPIIFQINSAEFNEGNPIQYSFESTLDGDGGMKLQIKKATLTLEGDKSEWVAVDSPDEQFMAIYNYARLMKVDNSSPEGSGFKLINSNLLLPGFGGNATLITRSYNGQPRVSIVNPVEGGGSHVYRPVFDTNGELRLSRVSESNMTREDEVDALIYRAHNGVGLYFGTRFGKAFLQTNQGQEHYPSERAIIKAAENYKCWNEIQEIVAKEGVLQGQLDDIQDSVATRMGSYEEDEQTGVITVAENTLASRIGNTRAVEIADLWLTGVNYDSKLVQKELDPKPRSMVTGIAFSPDTQRLVVNVSSGKVLDKWSFPNPFGKNGWLDYSVIVDRSGHRVEGEELDTLAKDYSAARGIYESVAYALLSDASKLKRFKQDEVVYPVMVMDVQDFANIATARQDACTADLCVETIYDANEKEQIIISGCFIDTQRGGEIRLEEKPNGDIFVSELKNNGVVEEEIIRPPDLKEYLLYDKLKRSKYGTLADSEVDEAKAEIEASRESMESSIESKLLRVAEDPDLLLRLFLLLAADEDSDAVELVREYVGSSNGAEELSTLLDKILAEGSAVVGTREQIFMEGNASRVVMLPSDDGEITLVGDDGEKTRTLADARRAGFVLPSRYLSFRIGDDGQLEIGPDFIVDGDPRRLMRGGEEFTLTSTGEYSTSRLLGRNKNGSTGGRETEESFTRGLVSQILLEGLSDYTNAQAEPFQRRWRDVDNKIMDVIIAHLVYRLTGTSLRVRPGKGLVFDDVIQQGGDAGTIIQTNIEHNYDTIFKKRIIEKILQKFNYRAAQRFVVDSPITAIA